MIRFLREDRLGAEFKRLSAAGGEIALVAPYWGIGVVRLLGLKATLRLKVLCRFDAPACNPKSLLQLVDLGAKVRSHRRLHAKIYLTPTAVIVGSSNPSQYGLTEEGDLFGGTVEANVLTDDPDVRAATWGLFKSLWNDKFETSRVTRKMIQREIERRALEPPLNALRTLKARGLLDACREAPELFQNVVLGAYSSDLEPGGKHALKALQAGAASPNLEMDIADFRNAWAYQFEEGPPAGAWVIDVDCRQTRPRIRGASKVPSPALRLKVEGEHDVTPTIRGVIKVPGARGEFRIHKLDRDQLALVAPHLLRGPSFQTLPTVIKTIDRAERRAANALSHCDALNGSLSASNRLTFATAYAELAAEILPQLKLQPSNNQGRANTRSFKKIRLGQLSQLWPRHELGPSSSSGYVNVLFPRAASKQNEISASDILDGTNYMAAVAHRSLAIRAQTPGIDPTRPFSEQQEAVAQSLEIMKNLVDWVRLNDSEFAALLAAN